MNLKIFKSLLLIFAISITINCNDKKVSLKNNLYTFTKDYCTTIVVGGVVGIKKKCYKVNDIVTAETIRDSSIIIRIAQHNELNDTKGPTNFQELLEIPLEFLEEKNDK
jgi:hypothetical protein